MRLLFFCQCSCRQTFTHQPKGPSFILRIGFTTELLHPGPKHIVAYPGHQWRRKRQCIRQFQMMNGKFMSSIIQIQLIKNTTFIITSQHRPVHNPKGITLGSQTTKIGISGNLIGRQSARTFPYFLTFLKFGFGNHPTHYQPQLFYCRANRKQTGSLQIVSTVYLFNCYFATRKPFTHRNSLINSPFLCQCSFKGIIKSIGASYVLSLSQRYHINTYPRRHIEFPIISRNPCYNCLSMDVPLLAHTAVFYPDFRIVSSKTICDISILHKHSRMRFHLTMHDFTLVVHQILNSQRGRD